jgi:AmmeMemoRadiSam system protein A
MSSNRSEQIATLSDAERTLLLQLARASIAHGLTHGRPVAVSLHDYPERLRAQGAGFVTLHRHDQLRGCIGSLEAQRPLVEDIASNAHAAAFRDPRFPSLTPGELDELMIHIAILQPAQALTFHSEAELLAQLRPGIDGLILQDGAHRATFLPAVWEGLPEPREFLNQLKRKAGLRLDYWSDSMQAWRYTTESFP